MCKLCEKLEQEILALQVKDIVATTREEQYKAQIAELKAPTVAKKKHDKRNSKGRFTKNND